MGLDPKFKLNREKCIRCSKCLKVCEGLMLKADAEGYPMILEPEAWEARGCWGCQHCLAVCPQGAISIMGKDPANSALPPEKDLGEDLERLMMYRRSCRRFAPKPVDEALVDRILNAASYAPTGGNRQSVEFTVVTDPTVMKKLNTLVHKEMERNAAQGIFPGGINQAFYDFLIESEKVVRPNDLIFCSAPNLFIAHQQTEPGSVWERDDLVECGIASTYFELLCAAHGLGAVMMSTSISVLDMVPEAKKLLGIPDDHCIAVVVGFGYPEIHYARSAQRDGFTAISKVTAHGIETTGRVGGHYAPNEALD